MRRVAPILLMALASCGPVSPQKAADICEHRARAATGPTGAIGVGVSSGGKVGGAVEVGVTSDYIYGRDPYEVYDSCVRQMSGQGPIRPLNLAP